MMLNKLNTANDAKFLQLTGGPLEGETWLAQRVLQARPFASLDALMQAFEQVMSAATSDEKIRIIASHPDLAIAQDLSETSQKEQASAGLNHLSAEDYAAFLRLNAAYHEKFAFPFVICVREHDVASILAHFKKRLDNSREQEIQNGVAEVLKIIRLRLIDLLNQPESSLMKHTISYGKGNIALYRFHAAPLTGLTPIPESPYTGQENHIMAASVDVEVFGDIFLPAYTKGDNSQVVATATMTNFTFHKAREYTGATLEGLVYFLACELLAQYPQIEAANVSAKELPFEAAPLTDDSGATLAPSELVFSPKGGSYGVASLRLERTGDALAIADQRSGRHGLKLLKLTGSAFTNFHRDEYTSLPDAPDRPLYIFCDVSWRYDDAQHAISDDYSQYIAPQQVDDHLRRTFHDFQNESIQHLINEMGERLLDRFPQMREVSFAAQNRLWDKAVIVAGEDAKVYMDPRPPYGNIKLTISRS